ncbi:hypothetical protein KSF78_0009000 [Schistosoma japonicum]|nr:hypothetical protein KSF78_0009000 [Schistosoma japonicum]KAH8858750.1 hypothetical protein KSF78_0009000 [Schistosoma japonicum]
MKISHNIFKIYIQDI